MVESTVGVHYAWIVTNRLSHVGHTLIQYFIESSSDVASSERWPLPEVNTLPLAPFPTSPCVSFLEQFVRFTAKRSESDQRGWDAFWDQQFQCYAIRNDPDCWD